MPVVKEGKAREEIARLLLVCWKVCDPKDANIIGHRGVAIREFRLEQGPDLADYLLYIDGQAADFAAPYSALRPTFLARMQYMPELMEKASGEFRKLEHSFLRKSSPCLGPDSINRHASVCESPLNG